MNIRNSESTNTYCAFKGPEDDLHLGPFGASPPFELLLYQRLSVDNRRETDGFEGQEEGWKR